MTTETQTQLLCPLCQHESYHEGLCGKCHRRIFTQLDDLLDLWEAAHHELLPGQGGHGSSSSERTIGLNVLALSFIAGDDILNLLHEWEKYIRAERNLTPPALVKKEPTLAKEIEAAVKFAQAHLEWSGQQSWISDFAKELRDLHSTAVAAARRFVQKVRRIPCPADTAEGLPCGNLLVVQEDILAIFECKRCESQWSSYRLIAVALSNPNDKVWLDIEAIASWVGMTERGVRQLVERNGIERKGQLYDFKAILSTRENVV
jgi:hypothetical protein